MNRGESTLGKIWYVVHTRPHAERSAVDNLSRQGYETYLPCCRRWRRHARRKEVVQRPLFPRYAFVALDLMRDRWRPILSTFGVADVVRAGDGPAAVPIGVVEQIRDQERGGAFDETTHIGSLPAGAAVRVSEGPFAGLIGRLQRLAEGGRVAVLLELLGREVATQLRLDQLEPV